MEGFYGWIRNITYYLIFMTVAVNLLPNKKYEKYFRLFAGMVLILLVLKPFTGGLRLDDKLAYAFESISFRQEASELRQRLSKMEGKRLENAIRQYEEAVENDLKTMAETSGFVCERAVAVIDGNEEEESFGRVISIYMALAGEKKEALESGGERVTVEPVGPVQIDLDGEREKNGERESYGERELNGKRELKEERELKEKRGLNGRETAKNRAREEGNRRQSDNSALAALRKRISEYYNLEEQNIEIQMEDGEG